MAKEIKAYGLSAGVNYFATVQNTAGNYWTGTGNNFAAASGITWSAAGIALTADATITRDYAADFPTAITSAGRYVVKVYSRAGGSPVVGDVQGIPAAKGLIEWDGTAELLLGVVVTNRDKTGYSLGSAEHLLIGNDVLDAMMTSHIAAGSVGAKINATAGASGTTITNTGSSIVNTDSPF